MVNGLVYFRPRANYFAFQQSDTVLQFGDGERVEILPGQQGERIIRLSWKIVIHIHGDVVDPIHGPVNKSL